MNPNCLIYRNRLMNPLVKSENISVDAIGTTWFIERAQYIARHAHLTPDITAVTTL